jgi:hypothetical protein
MKMYRHSTTGALIEFLGDNGATAKIKDIDTGETKEISMVTLRRWWKLVDDENIDCEQNASETAELDKDTPADLDENTDFENTECAQDVNDNTQAADSAPLALSEVVDKLEKLFDMLNGIYFESALPRPIITVQSTPKTYGHCSSQKIWSSGVENEGEAYYEINIGAEYLNRQSEATAATMCHEMVHLFCRENGLKETCQGVRYHNKVFKAEAEKRDLQVNYDRSIGYSQTIPTDAFIAKLREAGYALEIPFARHALGIKKKTAARAKRYRYFCPICGQEARGGLDLNLICGTCQTQMERAS